MKRNPIIILACLLVMIPLSCKQGLIVQKKRYNPGYHVSIPNILQWKRDKVNPITLSKFHNNTVSETQNISENVNYDFLKFERDSSAFLLQNNNVKQTVKTEKNAKTNDIPINIAANQYKKEYTKSSTKKTYRAEKSIKDSIKDSILFGATALFLFSFLFGFRKKLSRPNKISFWAAKNKFKAQTVLALAHVALIGSSLTAGYQFGKLGFETSHISTYILASLGSAVILLAPIRGVTKGFFKSNFKKQKTFTAALVVLSTSLMFNIGNRQYFDNTTIPYTSNMSIFKNSDKTISKVNINEVQKQSGPEDDERYLKSNGINTLAKVFLTLLSLVLAYFLILIIGALSCSLMCSGAEVAGAIVLVFGIIGIIILLILTLIKIWIPKKVKSGVTPAEQ